MGVRGGWGDVNGISFSPSTMTTLIARTPSLFCTAPNAFITSSDASIPLWCDMVTCVAVDEEPRHGDSGRLGGSCSACLPARMGVRRVDGGAVAWPANRNSSCCEKAAAVFQAIVTLQIREVRRLICGDSTNDKQSAGS